MADPHAPAAEADGSSSDEDTVKGDSEADRIVEIFEEERQAATTPVPLGTGSVAGRYHEILEEVEAQEEDSSVVGSTDAIPRRAGSPIDSLLSAPDDTPSVQVGLFCWETCQIPLFLMLTAFSLSGLRPLVTEQQCAALCRLPTWAE